MFAKIFKGHPKNTVLFWPIKTHFSFHSSGPVDRVVIAPITTPLNVSTGSSPRISAALATVAVGGKKRRRKKGNRQNKIKSEATEIGLAIGRSIGYGMKLEKKGGADDTEEAAADGQNKSDTAAADDTAGEAAADAEAAKKSAKKPYFEKTPFFTDEEFEKGRQKEEKEKNKSIQPDTREYFNFKKKFLKQKSDEYSVQKLKEAEQQDAQKPKYSVFYVQGFTAGYAQGQQFRRTEEAQNLNRRH